MEVYAGFMEHTDHHVGRLIDAINDPGIMDDTLILVIIGDNGASAEGTIQGSFNEMIMLNAITGVETPEFLLSKLEKLGSPDVYNHYWLAGHGLWIHHTSGLSRWRLTGGAREMVR